MKRKILIAPDKFKGSLSSFDICRIIGDTLSKSVKDISPLGFPMADGGDGFASVIRHYLRTETIVCTTSDPLGRPIEGAYEWDEESKTAIIELATASGLVLLKKDEQNPLHTSTYGTGLLVAQAIEKGARKIILGIGGSATNDAGTGILAALGFIFIDKQEQALYPSGASLGAIEKIIVPADLPDIEFEIACDVRNTLFGMNGAAYVYAPQKGAGSNEVELLDKGLQNFAHSILQHTGKDIAYTPGSGAAGGVAAGLMAFFKVTLLSGAEKIILISDLEEHLQDAALLITGEGKLDDQSGSGKVIAEIAAIGRKFNVPVIAVCGKNELSENSQKQMGLAAVHALTDIANEEEAIKFAAVFLNRTIKALLPSIEMYIGKE